MMKLLYAADIHVNRSHLGRLIDVAEREDAETIVIGGDVTPKDLFETHGLNKLVRGQKQYLEKEFVPLLEQFHRRNAAIAVFLDLANDDFSANRRVLEEAEREGFFHLLHMAVHPLNDNLDIVGYMGVPITPFGIKDWERPDKKGMYPPLGSTTHGWISTQKSGMAVVRHTINVREDPSIEDELSELERNIRKPFILISHAPPYQTKLDVLYTHEHVGSIAVREFIEKWGARGLLQACFHGHIHESPRVSGSDVDSIAGVECWNPGQEGQELRYVVYDIGDF